ncbi:MAG: extracellular solute-binding protein [Aggregatilineales bacterium]
MNTRQRMTVIFSVLALLIIAAAPSATVFSQSATQTPAPTPTIPPTVISSGEGCAPGATKVTWFVGLGGGTNATDIPKEKAWTDKYNKSQTFACVILQVVHNPEARDVLKAMIAGGTPPDIVGPVGKIGRELYRGSWADITPLAKAANFDLSKYDPILLDFVKDEGVQVGLPFALFPGVLYYNKALFDEAKLPYPPHKVGEQYMGKDWTIDTLSALAKKLTVDKAGNDATQTGFDPNSITQFGMWMGYHGMRRITAMFGGAVPYDSNNNAVIPDSWRAFYNWYYDAMWTSHFQPTSSYANSDLFGKGNPFGSGNVAMTWTLTWYTCCFDMKKLNWDIAVVPSYNGKITAGMDGDTFAIPKGSKNQDVAFKVLSQMVVDKELPIIYGGIPGNTADRASYFASLNDLTAPNKIDWNVALEMLKYPNIPHHESWMPNLLKAETLLDAWVTMLDQTPGLDVNKELDKLQVQLDAIFKQPAS